VHGTTSIAGAWAIAASYGVPGCCSGVPYAREVGPAEAGPVVLDLRQGSGSEYFPGPDVPNGRPKHCWSSYPCDGTRGGVLVPRVISRDGRGLMRGLHVDAEDARIAG
jgi:hypothetical protein